MFAKLVEMYRLENQAGDPAWLLRRHFASSLRALRYRF